MTTWPIQPYHPSDRARSVAHVLHVRKQHATHKQVIAIQCYGQYVVNGIPACMTTVFSREHDAIFGIKECVR